jgi:hypothetical protein
MWNTQAHCMDKMQKFYRLEQMASTRLLSRGTGCDFPGGKAGGCEADHSPPSSAEVKNDGVIPPLPHMSS